jgi:hypothetical protein
VGGNPKSEIRNPKWTDGWTGGSSIQDRGSVPYRIWAGIEELGAGDSDSDQGQRSAAAAGAGAGAVTGSVVRFGDGGMITSGSFRMERIAAEPTGVKGEPVKPVRSTLDTGRLRSLERA